MKKKERKIIYSFEKHAYNNPEDALSQDVTADPCLKLADVYKVAAIFGYGDMIVAAVKEEYQLSGTMPGYQ